MVGHDPLVTEYRAAVFGDTWWPGGDIAAAAAAAGGRSHPTVAAKGSKQPVGDPQKQPDRERERDGNGPVA